MNCLHDSLNVMAYLKVGAGQRDAEGAGGHTMKACSPCSSRHCLRASHMPVCKLRENQHLQATACWSHHWSSQLRELKAGSGELFWGFHAFQWLLKTEMSINRSVFSCTLEINEGIIFLC